MKRYISLALCIILVFCLVSCDQNLISGENPLSSVGGNNSHTSSGTIKKDPEQAKVGDYILFGNYEQDNNTNNGKEKIEWLVLDKKGERLLVISKYNLDSLEFNIPKNPSKVSGEEAVWESCTLRKWLNNDFLNTAFSAEEQKNITISDVPAHKNPAYDTDPGKDTQDKIFLLSISEVNRYFPSKESRVCENTAYIKALNPYDSDPYSWWLLRTPGSETSMVTAIVLDGVVYNSGLFIWNKNGIRPAMWIELNSIS